jgi:hypothetical protein
MRTSVFIRSPRSPCCPSVVVCMAVYRRSAKGFSQRRLSQNIWSTPANPLPVGPRRSAPIPEGPWHGNSAIPHRQRPPALYGPYSHSTGSRWTTARGPRTRLALGDHPQGHPCVGQGVHVSESQPRHRTGECGGYHGDRNAGCS